MPYTSTYYFYADRGNSGNTKKLQGSPIRMTTLPADSAAENLISDPEIQPSPWYRGRVATLEGLMYDVEAAKSA